VSHGRARSAKSKATRAGKRGCRQPGVDLSDIAPLQATRRYSTLQVIPICWLTRPPCNRDGGRCNGSICGRVLFISRPNTHWARQFIAVRLSEPPFDRTAQIRSRGGPFPKTE
jgi:hypothetical protein